MTFQNKLLIYILLGATLIVGTIVFVNWGDICSITKCEHVHLSDNLISSSNRATDEDLENSDDVSDNIVREANQVVETTDEIKAYIVEVAENYGIDPELALKIAECESNFKNVCNYKHGCIAGIGIYQIVQSTFDEAVEKMYIDYSELSYKLSGISPHNIKDNIDVALWLMSKGQYEKWRASNHCWKGAYWKLE